VLPGCRAGRGAGERSVSLGGQRRKDLLRRYTPSQCARSPEHKKLRQTDDLPYETRIAQRNFPVTLYVGSVCDEVCNQAHSLLNRRGIPFAEKVLKTSKDIAAYKQLSGMDAFVPALQVGTTFIKGFQESQWNNELDIAGYAKTASYRQRLQQQSPPPIPETPPADADQDFSAESAVQ
jgi:glutaredoxin